MGLLGIQTRPGSFGRTKCARRKPASKFYEEKFIRMQHLLVANAICGTTMWLIVELTHVQKVVQSTEGTLAKNVEETHGEELQSAAQKQFCADTTVEKTRAIKGISAWAVDNKEVTTTRDIKQILRRRTCGLLCIDRCPGQIECSSEEASLRPEASCESRTSVGAAESEPHSARGQNSR